jgi:hypothetical protein
VVQPGRPRNLACRFADRSNHPGEQILRGLDARFTRRHTTDAPYLFADLADISEAEEQAAIDASQIQAIGVRYTATRP